MADSTNDDLVRDLTRLGRAIRPDISTDRLATAVLDRVSVTPRASAPRRRRIALVVAAVLIALLATPPVRAAVAGWFGFGGVVVEPGAPPQGPASQPPEVPSDGSLSEAATAVDFTLWVPTELGVPDGVEVSPDRRVVSMSWSTVEAGVLRLDQFDARFDFAFAKRTPGVTWVDVGGSDALWFDEPHEVVLLEPDGTRRSESARLAGHTLVLPDGSTTRRLEGGVSLGRAIEIAESLVPVP